MTDRKFTDDEIIRALEFCIQNSECEYCEYRERTDKTDICPIRSDALDLINRQKAEIAYWMDAAANAKKEAVKEFAEKLKKYAEVVTTLSDDETILAIQDHFVDEVAEEMMGGQNG